MAHRPGQGRPGLTDGRPRCHRWPRRARAGRVRRWASPRRRPLVPTARLTRVEDHLRGHWTGGTGHGGPFPWTTAEEEAILVLGWHRPSRGDGVDYVRFWPDDVPQGPYLPRADADRAAERRAPPWQDAEA